MKPRMSSSKAGGNTHTNCALRMLRRSMELLGVKKPKGAHRDLDKVGVPSGKASGPQHTPRPLRGFFSWCIRTQHPKKERSEMSTRLPVSSVTLATPSVPHTPHTNPVDSTGTENPFDSDYEYYDSEEEEVMCIPRGLRDIMQPVLQQRASPRFSISSSSSLGTVIHHEDMSGPHVARIADVYDLHQPRLLPGPARQPIPQLPDVISDSSSEELGDWDSFSREVMVTRTLSQCQRVTMAFKRGRSLRTRMARYETREADNMPLLDRTGTNDSAVSYPYLCGPHNLVVANP